MMSFCSRFELEAHVRAHRERIRRPMSRLEAIVVFGVIVALMLGGLS